MIGAAVELHGVVVDGEGGRVVVERVSRRAVHERERVGVLTTRVWSFRLAEKIDDEVVEESVRAELPVLLRAANVTLLRDHLGTARLELRHGDAVARVREICDVAEVHNR